MTTLTYIPTFNEKQLLSQIANLEAATAAQHKMLVAQRAEIARLREALGSVLNIIAGHTSEYTQDRFSREINEARAALKETETK